MKSPYLRYTSYALAFLGTLMLGMGLWLTWEHHLLRSEGVEVQARVEHKEAKGRPGQETFTVQLVPEDQPDVSIKVRMTAEQYAGSAEGDSITMSYVPSDPAIHMLGSLDQARGLEVRDRESIIGGVLLLALAAGLFWYAGRRPKPRRRSAKD